MTNDSTKERRVVNVFKQFLILFWKNWLLFRRNILGSISEVLVALLMVFILIIMRVLIDSSKFNEQNEFTNPPVNILSRINVTSGRNLILFYPNNAFIQGIVQNAYSIITDKAPAFTATVSPSTESDGLKLDPTSVSNLFAFISFPSTYTSAAAVPNKIEYDIYTQERAPYQYNILSNFYKMNNFLYDGSPESYCGSKLYYQLYTTVFNPIKYALDLSLINTLESKTLNSDQVKMAQFHCLEYENDIFKSRFSFFPLILICLAYIFTLIVNLGNIITEKQSKMKEYLKLMGIKWYVIWINWLVRSLIPYMVLTLIISLLAIIKMNARVASENSTKKAIFMHTNFFVGFSLLFIYSIQTAMFTLMLGQIFSKTFVAKVFAIIFWIMTAINFYGDLPSSGVKYIFCMFPNSALLFAFQTINQYERSSESMTYKQLYSNIYDDPQNLGAILSAMIFWTLVYVPITWYIERIFPGEYGAPLPFYFPFMPSYWKGTNSDQVSDKDDFDRIKNDQFGFEKDPDGLNMGISIRKITKKFRIGFKDKTVVDNMSINFYENQITGLLGHNGAGKTTTTFMLCGIYAPDSGDAFVLGKSIRNQMDQIRSSLGFCPQHDILFDDLTVSEHLDLIGSIKGYKGNELKEEILEISTLVGLQNDLEKKSKQLSGGMKRRLSVAMALTGGSKVIILDEPTSGLDPYNRRGLWELIRKFKQGRSILLTTHFMEEADALSDRIAIMNHGKVKCCGTPLFLKNTFGSGYLLTIAKNESFMQDQFLNVLTSQAEKYSIDSNIAAEMSVSIPFTQNAKLSQLLTTLENNKQKMGIDGYGISSPTIEEVFIKIGSIDRDVDEVNINELKNENLDVNPDKLTNAFSQDFKKNTGFLLWIQQIQSLLVKRFFIFIKRFVLAGVILILPFLMEAVLSALIPSQTNLINSIRNTVSSEGKYELKITNYGNQKLPYRVFSNNSISTTSLKSMIDGIYTSANKPGVQMESVDTDVNSYVLELRKKNLIDNMIKNYYVGFSWNLAGATDLHGSVYFSTLAFHSSANMLNDAMNVMYSFARNYVTDKSIKTTNIPIKSNNSLGDSRNYLEVLACIDSFPVSLLNFINAVIVAFMISIMVMHVARERTNGSKQLQMLSGLHYGTYWFSNFLFDMAIYIFNISTMVFFLKMVDLGKNDTSSETYAIAGDQTLGYFYLLLLFSSLSWCVYAYIWSFLFKTDIICFVVLLIILGFAAFLDSIWVFIQLLVLDGSKTQTPGSNFIFTIRIIFTLLFPNIVIKRGLYNLKIRSNAYCIDAVNKNLATSFVVNEDYLAFKEPGIGMLVLFCFLQFLVGVFILFLIESGVLKKINIKKLFNKKVHTQDDGSMLEEDVKKESDRIKSADLKELSTKEPLVVAELLKKFQKNKKEFVAVNRLSFGIDNKECFGLLGLNGAGKTTTFKILTGEIDATEGKAFINGFDINKDRMKARSSLGFCPQFDYLPEYLTVTQAFELFAGLRGLERSSKDKTLNELIDVFKLNEFTRKQVQTLSGGNKRKVSSGIAFIGRPSVIILDEPTTGMDPSARRYLWTVIKKARDLGLTIVLTTHSMEECEALSTRLGIMVNGQFKCMGSIQHLKSKFGKGYSLVVKCKNLLSEEEIDNVQRFIQNKIPASVLKDKQQETLFYQIEYQDNQKLQTIAELFTLIESNKESLKIETYSLSQTTLEQVFLSFAKEQHNIDEKNEKDIKKLEKENLYKKEKSNMSMKNGKFSREQSSDRSVQDDVV